MNRLLLCLLLLGTGLTSAMATEEPAYQVLERDGAFELRSYGAILVAETQVESSFGDAGNAAFRRLFRYISGGNQGERKIAMTAPVMQESATNGFRVAFVMPATLTPATVPQPSESQVRIREIPAQTMAVLRYSGRWTEKLYREHEAQLLGMLASRGLVATAAPVYSRYNAPFVPWLMRRNEVMVAVTRSSSLSTRPQ